MRNHVCKTHISTTFYEWILEKVMNKTKNTQITAKQMNDTQKHFHQQQQKNRPYSKFGYSPELDEFN